MEFTEDLISPLTTTYSRPRSRSPRKTENFVNIDRKPTKSITSSLRTHKPEFFFSNHLVPLSPKELLKELSHDTQSVEGLRSAVDILNRLRSQGDTYLTKVHGKRFKAHEGSIARCEGVKKLGFEGFLMSHELSDISVTEIKNIYKSLELYNDFDLFSTINGAKISYRDIKTLKPEHCPNEKIINSYLNLCPTAPHTHVFSTFFFQILQESSDSIETLQDALNISGLESILCKKYLILPIYLDKVHCLVVTIDNSKRVIEYYDSLSTQHMEYVCGIVERALETLGVGRYDWEVIAVPMQCNESDCGVIAVKCILALCKNIEFSFRGDEVKYYRKVMIAEIKHQRLL